MCEKLKADGHTVESPLSTEALLHNWMKIQRRHIEPKKRQIVFSRALEARLMVASETHAKAVDRLRVAIEVGDDLTPFMSRDLGRDRSFRKNDGMLDDFGIHHFHMGEGFETKGLVGGDGTPPRSSSSAARWGKNKGFVKGIKELIYGVVTDDTAYLIEIFTHDDFCDEKSFRIAQRDWPHLYERLKAPFMLSRDPSNHLSREARKIIRGSNGNAPLTSDDGTIFMSPGGGQNSAGFSPWIVRDADVLLTRLQELERDCRTNVQRLVDAIFENTGKRSRKLRLRLFGFTADRRVLVRDDESGVQFGLT